MVRFIRGYANGEKTIEILDGNLDVVLYHEKKDKFYFYRFSPEEVLGVPVSSSTRLLFPDQVKNYIEPLGFEYNGLINQLLLTAMENQMSERYDM